MAILHPTDLPRSLLLTRRRHIKGTQPLALHTCLVLFIMTLTTAGSTALVHMGEAAFILRTAVVGPTWVATRCATITI